MTNNKLCVQIKKNQRKTENQPDKNNKLSLKNKQKMISNVYKQATRFKLDLLL